MKALCWEGVNEIAVEDGPRPAILNDQTHREGRADRDLRLGPAPARRLHPRHARGRRARARVHGRGRRGRPRGHEAPQVGDRVVVVLLHQLRPVLVLQARAVVAVRQRQPQPGDHRGAVGPVASAAATATPTPWAAARAATPSTSGCPTPTMARSRSPTASRDERALFASDAAPDRLDGRGPRRRAGRVTSSRCGVPAASGQMAARAAMLLGAERVIVIDRLPDRLEQVAHAHRAETLDYDEDDVTAELRELHRRPGTRRVHRGGGHGGAQPRAAVPLRPGQAAAAAADRPARPRCARRSTPAARAGRCSPSASSAASSTSSRSAR